MFNFTNLIKLAYRDIFFYKHFILYVKKYMLLYLQMFDSRLHNMEEVIENIFNYFYIY